MTMTLNKILLVEDDPIQLSALKILVATLLPQAQLLAVPDGYDAVTQAPLFQPDAIISDVSMPVADGLSFLHALLPQLTKRPHILVLTAYDRMQLRRFGPLPEHAQFLQKPVSLSALAATIATWSAADAAPTE